MTGYNFAPLFVIIPMGAAFLCSVFRGYLSRKIYDACSCLLALILFVLSMMAVYAVNVNGTIVYNVGSWKPPIGITMILDGFSAFMLIVVNLIAVAAALFSVNYMERFTAKWKYYSLFFLMLSGMNGVIVAGDIFNLFVFLEISSFASYALVAFGTEKNEIEAAFKYAIMGSVAAIFILFGIVLLYGYTSTLNMADMANNLALKGEPKLILLVSVFFLMGFGLKSALVPFHGWLADAHPAAPAPISAMLSGVIIKSLGVYAMARIFFNVIGMTPQLSGIFMFLGALSMFVGAALAMAQKDFKRLLAYSSVSQIGYIFLGLGVGSKLALIGTLLHIFSHSVFKSLLFLNSGAVEYSTGTRDMDKLGGLQEKMPFTGRSAVVASMSISGIPPFSGFFSKLIIILAAAQAGYYGYSAWAALISILTLSVVLKALKSIFFGKLPEGLKAVKEVPALMKFAMGILAVISIFGGLLLLEPVRKPFIDNAAGVIADGRESSIVISRKLNNISEETLKYD